MLLISIENGVARLTMNRPRQFNAISMDMLVALQSALDDIAANRDIRAVVIAGSGPAFSGGHDLKEMMANRHESFIGALFERCSNWGRWGHDDQLGTVFAHDIRASGAYRRHAALALTRDLLSELASCDRRRAA